MTNRAAFFASVRKDFGSLTQGQVDGFNAILDAWGARDPKFVAYALATAWHETARRMRPIKEFGGPSYYKRMYDIEGERPDKARVLGNIHPGDGAKFCGRGYVQLTGRSNYARAGNAIGVDMIAAPDAAMVPEYAAKIMVRGMLEGWFTGRKLSDFYGGGGEFDAVNARRIINGTDKAKTIAAHYRAFLVALLSSQTGDCVPPPPDIAKPKKPAPEPSKAPQTVSIIVGVIMALIAAAAAYLGLK
jgi:putative chitinase